MAPAFASPAALRAGRLPVANGTPSRCPAGRRRGHAIRGARAATWQMTAEPAAVVKSDAFTAEDAVAVVLQAEPNAFDAEDIAPSAKFAVGDAFPPEAGAPASVAVKTDDASPEAAFAATDALLSEDEFVPGDPLPEPSSPTDPLREAPAAPVGKKVKLQALLSKAGVASSETCALLVRTGLVRVNREKVTDPLTRVHESDRIEVQGVVLGEAPEKEPRLPRAQRDLPAREIPNRYSRQVDRGFFAQRTAHRRR